MSTVAAIVTWKRPEELRRLLAALAQWEKPPRLTVIADHAPDGQCRMIARECPLSVCVLENAANPGPGAGWSLAAAEALRRCPEAQAVWFLDDDVVVSAQAASRLMQGLETAGLVAPLLENAQGRLWAFPEPVNAKARRLIRQAVTPADALLGLGAGPHELCWCTGACVAVAVELYRKIGPHRSDFFMLGEDLEFSMRAAGAGRAVFYCDAVVPHLPPERAGASQPELVKFCSLLQNLSWLSFRSPHSRHMKSYLPGNFRRFFGMFGAAGLPLALQCFYFGAFCGEPAGGRLGAALRARLTSARSS